MRFARAVLVAAAAASILAFGPEASAATTQISNCDQTVTTNAVFTKSLFCPGLPGVVVGASGITIDLKGFRLRGDNTAGKYGVDDSGGFGKVTVRNGVLRNFAVGVFASGDNVGISNLIASGSSAIGIFVNGSSAKIASATAAGNASFGIAATGDSASITSSRVSGNGGVGISVSGDSASISSSTATGNGSNGISIVGGAASIRSATVSGNGGNGISAGAGVSITSATATGNGGNGISVGGPSASIKSSTVYGNADNGIVVDGNAASLKGNHADANGFPAGASDLAGLGIFVHNFTTAPAGTNTANGNDDRAECDPASLC
jgi:large repetitive protein